MLRIEVKAHGGQDIAEAIEEMCVLASRLGHMVSAELNEVHTTAHPGSDPRELFAKWKTAMESDAHSRHKFATAFTVELPRALDQGKTSQEGK